MRVGGRVAARGAGPERGRVPRAVQAPSSLPRGAVRDALAGRVLACPACRHRGFCALRTHKVFQCNRVRAALAHRRHRVPGHQAAAHDLVRGRLPPDPRQERDQLDRAGAAARGAAAHGLAGEAQADAGDGRARGGEAEALRPGRDGQHAPWRGAPEAASTAGARPARRPSSPRSRPRRGAARAAAAHGGQGLPQAGGRKLAKAAIEPGATVVSDGLSCWPAVEGRVPHFPMVTGAGKRPARWTPLRVGEHHARQREDGDHRHVPPRQRQARQGLPDQLHLPLRSSFPARQHRQSALAWAAVHTAPQPYRIVVADV